MTRWGALSFSCLVMSGCMYRYVETRWCCVANGHQPTKSHPMEVLKVWKFPGFRFYKLLILRLPLFWVGILLSLKSAKCHLPTIKPTHGKFGIWFFAFDFPIFWFYDFLFWVSIFTLTNEIIQRDDHVGLIECSFVLSFSGVCIDTLRLGDAVSQRAMSLRKNPPLFQFADWKSCRLYDFMLLWTFWLFRLVE